MLERRFNDSIVPYIPEIMEFGGVDEDLVSEEAVRFIEGKLGLKKTTDFEELTAIRNSVVMYFIKEKKKHPEDAYDIRNFLSMWCSAITCVIDNRIYG